MHVELIVIIVENKTINIINTKQAVLKCSIFIKIISKREEINIIEHKQKIDISTHFDVYALQQ